jgi:hypothetical protein
MESGKWVVVIGERIFLVFEFGFDPRSSPRVSRHCRSDVHVFSGGVPLQRRRNAADSLKVPRPSTGKRLKAGGAIHIIAWGAIIDFVCSGVRDEEHVGVVYRVGRIE